MSNDRINFRLHMKSVYHSQTPEAIGSLYSRDNERDNCGMGAIANINGVPSHEILNYELRRNFGLQYDSPWWS